MDRIARYEHDLLAYMHHPLRKVLLWAREQERAPQFDDARKLMTADKDCGELLAALGIFPPANMLAQLHQEIQEELASLLRAITLLR